MACLATQVITGSNKFPHISGYYKLLSVAMFVCDTTGLFAGLRWTDGHVEVTTASTADHDDAAVDDDDDATEVTARLPPAPDANRVYCFRLLGRFAEEVAARIRQYKDELLVACVRFLLGLPVQLSAKHVLTPALHAGLVFGRSHLPAASSALDALERWQRVHPEALQSLLPDTLPLLGHLLVRSKAFASITGLKPDDAAAAGAGKKKVTVVSRGCSECCGADCN